MACSFIEKETPAQMFYMNFAKFFRITFCKIPPGEWFWPATSIEAFFSIEVSCSWFALMAAASQIVATQLEVYG